MENQFLSGIEWSSFLKNGKEQEIIFNKEIIKYKITSSSKKYISDTYYGKSTKQVTSLCRSSGV